MFKIIIINFTNMEAANSYKDQVQNYLNILQNLSDEIKLGIISGLTRSLKKKRHKPIKAVDFEGIWAGDESAEELISMINKARFFDKKIEEME